MSAAGERAEEAAPGAPTAAGETGGPPRIFISDLPHTLEGEGRAAAGGMEITPELRVPGHDLVRVSVLATMADVITGSLATAIHRPSVALTVDLVVRVVGGAHGDAIDMGGRLVKVGSRVTVGEAWFTEPGTGRMLAHSTVTFASSPRPQDLTPDFVGGRPWAQGRLSAPFADALGTRTVAPGVVEVDRRPYTMQLSGTLQGGVVALIGELAAEQVLAGPVTELDVRYLSTVRVGPGRATGERLADGLARVEVVDAGNDDRVTAMILAGHRDLSGR